MISPYAFKHRYDILSAAYVVGSSDPASDLKDLQEAFRKSSGDVLQVIRDSGRLTLAQEAKLREDFVCKYVAHPERLASARLEAPVDSEERTRRLKARADALAVRIKRLEQAESILLKLRAEHAKLIARLG